MTNTHDTARNAIATTISDFMPGDPEDYQREATTILTTLTNLGWAPLTTERDRLTNANTQLRALADQRNGDEATRLAGKIEGVNLAIGYLDETIRNPHR
jgi:hypothetical protein